MDEIDRIIYLLDFEIDRLRSKARQPGWTKWALIGGVGTCGWLLLSELADKAISWPNVAVVFLLASLVLDMCLFLSAMFGILQEVPASETRVIFSRVLLGRNRLSLLFGFVRVCLLMVIGSSVLPGGFVRLCFWLWYGSFALAFLLAILFSFFEFPLLAGRAKTNLFTFLLEIVHFGCGFVGIFGIAQKLILSESLPIVYEWRTALLILAIVTLVSFVVRTDGEPYLLHSLVSIRQDLGLGRVDIESAKEQIDVALAGLTIDQMFQKDISEILRYFSSINAEFDEISKECVMIEKIEAKGQNLEDNDITVFQALKLSTTSRLKNIDKTMDLVRNRSVKMNRKMWIVRILAPSSQEKVQEVARKIIKGLDLVKDKIDICKQSFNIRSGDDEDVSLKT